MQPARPRAFDLLAVDLDGTLLNSQGRLPPENRAALHRAHAAGIRIVLCTGRAFAETRPILDQIGLDLDATITAFGALITDIPSGRTIERDLFDAGTARELSDWFLRSDQSVLWLVDRDQAGHDGYDLSGRRRNPAVDHWVRRTECRIQAIRDLSEAVHLPARISIIDEPAMLRRMSDDLGREFGERIRHNVLSAPTYQLMVIEAFAPHVNKWYGIERLCRRWNIDPRRTVAIGDEVNDVDMLRHAGLGFAMENAHPAAKAAAPRMTTSNDAAGVAAVIDEILGKGPN